MEKPNKKLKSFFENKYEPVNQTKILMEKLDRLEKRVKLLEEAYKKVINEKEN